MSALVDAARTYLGVKFRHRGRTRFGLDCAGLVWCAYRDCGHVLHDFQHYGREPYRDGLVTHVRQALGDPISEPLQPGDVVLMRYDVNPHHIAIIGDYAVGGLSMIHTSGEVERVSENILSGRWRGRITHTFRRPV
jgi:cell wall-associated NlpC family hydrolase